jgi:hypothetical protein
VTRVHIQKEFISDLNSFFCKRDKACNCVCNCKCKLSINNVEIIACKLEYLKKPND